MNYNKEFEGLVNEARTVSCEAWAKRNRWQLRKSGAYLTGPCPKCGGDDRFSIETVANKWVCRGCSVGGHDAISLVQLLHPGLKGQTMGETFLESCEIITGRKRSEAISDAEAAKRKKEWQEKQKKQEAESAKRRLQARKSANKIWTRARPAGQHLAEYLKLRGLETDVEKLSYALREIPDLDFWHERKVLHSGPAMIAGIQWANGQFGGVHRTWLDPAGKNGKAVILSPDKSEALDVKKVMGSMGDGAIRLFTPENPKRLVMGEGIETTLTPYVHDFQPDTAYWCAITLGHMSGRAGKDGKTGKRMPSHPEMADKRCFVVPEWVQELVLLGDGDSDPKKTKEALSRAARRAKLLRPEIVVKVAWPGIDGDFNDLVMGTNDD